MPQDLRIAIVGAGIGGLTAAAGLAADGHSVVIFDAFKSPRPVGSGLVIQPVGQSVLRSVGALEDALSHGRPIWRMQGDEVEHGRTVLSVDYGPDGGDVFGLAIQRPALFRAVHDAACRAGATLVTDAAVARLVGPDRVKFANGDVSKPFDLIVDASGVNSQLSEMKARALPFGALWATVPWPEEAHIPKGRLCQRYRRADRMVGVMPSGTRPDDDTESATIFWSLPRDSYDDWRAKGITAWQAEVAELWPEAGLFFASITDPDQMSFASYTHGTLKKNTNGALVHIGDAAHRASPQLGQGANMAMLDARALRLALRRWPLDEALQHFTRSRRWHVLLYQGMSRAFTPQYQSESRVLPMLRDRFLAPLSQIPPIPRILTRLVTGNLIPPLASLEPRQPPDL